MSVAVLAPSVRSQPFGAVPRSASVTKAPIDSHPVESLPALPVRQRPRRDVLEHIESIATMEHTSTVNVFDRVSLNARRTERFNDTEDWLTGPDQPLPAGLISPDRFAAALTAQAVEVLLGHRPVRQLHNWLSPGVYQALARRAGLGLRIMGTAPATKRPRVQRAMVCQPRRRIAEVTLVIHDGFRIRAAALRLEIRHDHWYVTALEIA